MVRDYELKALWLGRHFAEEDEVARYLHKGRLSYVGAVVDHFCNVYSLVLSFDYLKCICW